MKCDKCGAALEKLILFTSCDWFCRPCEEGSNDFEDTDTNPMWTAHRLRIDDDSDLIDEDPDDQVTTRGLLFDTYQKRVQASTLPEEEKEELLERALKDLGF